MNIEVEVRSFVTEQKYDELIEYFKKEGELVSEDEQVTYYFDCSQDLRIQKNKFYSKVWLKKGKLHDDHREEIEIKAEPEKFDEWHNLFDALGYGVEIKWFRKRHTFKWEDVEVMIDHTKGYGHIIELEKLTGEAEKEKTFEMLKKKIKSLGIEITPKEEFSKRYKHYKTNWKELTKNV